MKSALLKCVTWNKKLLKFPRTYFHFTVFSTRNTLFHSLGFLGATVMANITFSFFLNIAQINFFAGERSRCFFSFFSSVILYGTH